MSNFGNTNPAFNFWQYYGSGSTTKNQEDSATLTMPENGVASSVSFYCDTNGGTATFHGCIWANDGIWTLLAHGNGVGVGAGSQSVNGQHWHTDTLSSPYYIPAGTGIKIGWTRPTSASMLWSYQQASNTGRVANGPDPGNLGAETDSGGTAGCYITYTPVSTPSAVTNAATSIGTTDVVLNGAYSDGSWGAAGMGNTTYEWQYSTNSNMSGAITVGAGGFSGANVPESFHLTGLNAGTTYYFQAVATNSVGTGFGSVASFTTLNPANLSESLSTADTAAVKVAIPIGISETLVTFDSSQPYRTLSERLTVIDAVTGLIILPAAVIGIPKQPVRGTDILPVAGAALLAIQGTPR